MFDLNKILPMVLNLLSGAFGSGGKTQQNNAAPDFSNAGCPSANFGSGGGARHPYYNAGQPQYGESPSYNTNAAPNGAQPEPSTAKKPGFSPPPDFSNSYWSLPTYDIPESQAPPFETQTVSTQPENKPMFDINLIIQIVNQLASMFSNNVSTQKQNSQTQSAENSQKNAEKKETFSFISKYPRTDQFIFS